MLVKTKTLNIPTFALCYLINGDTDDLTQEEENIIKNWERQNGITAVIPTDTEPFFSPSNDISASLLACDVQECICVIS